MRTLAAVLALFIIQAAAPTQAGIPYFAKMRDVGITSAEHQNYAVVDGELWMNARSDLADLRLYSGSTEVPYALVVQRAMTSNSETKVPIVNLGRVGNAVQFVAEPGMDSEYDRIRLQLSNDARDFVTRTTVEGTDDLHSGRWTEVGTYPLYDFSKEKLGANLVIAIPTARFSFLRITIPDLRPDQIAGASVAMTSREEARWSDLATVGPKITEQPGKTVVEWREQTKAPVERLRFVVDPAQTNFRRHVEVYRLSDDETQDSQRRSQLLISEADIGRIHVERSGKVIDSEDLDVDLSGTADIFRVVIENGDDQPLKLHAVQPLTHERRIYFDPRQGGGKSLRLYYGDEALGAPVYDFAKLFRADPEAVAATLGSGQANPEYKGRPDQRPWTERHQWVLWVALVAAVLGLGAVALRGLRTNAAQS